MSSAYIECPEVVGKTIKQLRLHSTETETEVVIEFEDGTSFSSSHEVKSVIKAELFETGIGEPKVLKSYQE